MSLFSELKRRNVFRVATAYIIVGWLLTEVLATLMPMFGVPEWVGKAVVILVVVTFVPVLIFAWAFEMTPEGIKREKDVDRDASITSETGRKLDYVTIAAVVAGVAFLAWSKSGVDTPSENFEVTETSGAPSVAVLPFVNMSGNADNEYFSDGLTETLLHMLAQVPDIKVAARTSSFAFKGQQQDIRKIALALGVAHVLEGSVQRSGDKIRVTAQLIRADDGFHVWSSIYDRTLNDIFVIQDEIAKDVGESLTTSLLGEKPVTIEGIGTHDVVAYDLYLQALAHRANGSYGALRQAEELLKEALLLDAGFFDAKRELAQIYIQQQDTGLLDRDEAFANAVELLEQVLAERPDDTAAKALLIAFEAFQAESAGAYMAMVDAVTPLQALADQAPNDVDLKRTLYQVLENVGRLEEALAVAEQALSIDPMNAELHYALAIIHKRMKNYGAARAAFRRSLDLSPNQPNVYGKLAEISSAEGDGVGAIRSILESMRVDPKDHEIAAMLASYLYRIGLPEDGDYYRDRAVLMAPNSPSSRMAVLEGHNARGDWDASDRLARAMVADDIDERHGSYFEAVYAVLKNAIAREDIAEGLEFISRYQPGFNDPLSSEISFKVRFAQEGAFSAWDAVFGRDRASRMADDYWRVLMGSGLMASEWTETYMEVLALRGDVDEAIRFALDEVLTKPVTEAIWWRDIFDLPFMAAVVADSRVQAGLRKWDADLVQLQQDLRPVLDAAR
jgi:TolB-like protein/tetratricopeptide (TPR) repeat protein